MKTIFIQYLLVFSLLQGVAFGPQPQDSSAIEFRNARVENQYPESITASIEVCGRPSESKVVFHYKNPGGFRFAWEKDAWTLDKGQTSDNCEKRQYVLETSDMDVPPFSIIDYYWSVDGTSGTIGRSPTYLAYYKDERYQWQSMENDRLRIWWHDRPEHFGQEVLSVADAAMDHQQKFYGTSLDEPVTVVMLNTYDEFYEWQAETDYWAGFSFPEINLTVQLVEEEDGFDWLNDVVPHEISHIYYDHLVTRISGASRWLDEGLATYLEYSDHSYEWDVLQTASENGEILPLETLEGSFGDDPDKIDIAYAESYYAILYMKEVYGEESIKSLLAEFHDSQNAETAFQKAFGKGPEDFYSDYAIWLENRIKTPPPELEFPRTGIASSTDIAEKDNSVQRNIFLPVLSLVFAIILMALFLLFVIIFIVYRLTIHGQKK